MRSLALFHLHTQPCLSFLWHQSTAVAIALGIAGNIRAQSFRDHWYLDMEQWGWADLITIPLRMLLLMSFMIPISLKGMDRFIAV